MRRLGHHPGFAVAAAVTLAVVGLLTVGLGSYLALLGSAAVTLRIVWAGEGLQEAVPPAVPERRTGLAA